MTSGHNIPLCILYKIQKREPWSLCDKANGKEAETTDHPDLAYFEILYCIAETGIIIMW